jgi:hypothetical protein
MQITKTSVLTGIKRTKDLPITEEQYNQWLSGESLIQDIMPKLPAEDREFIKTGIIDEEWTSFFLE